MINRITIIGNLGKDAELKNLENTQLLSFSVATNENYKDKKGEWITKTEWHNVVMFGKELNYLSSLKKGSLVYIDGKVTYRSYEKDGVTKYVTEVVARSVKRLEKKEATEYANNDFIGGEPKKVSHGIGESPVTGDLPF